MGETNTTLDAPLLAPAPTLGLRPLLWAAGVLAVLTVVAHWVDVPLVTPLDYHRANLDGEDWYRFLRVLGFMGTWFAVGVVFALVDRRRAPPGSPSSARWPFLIIAPLIAGVVAEGLKLAIRRARPDAHAQHLHVFWPRPDSTGAGGTPVWTPAQWGWTADNPPPWGTGDPAASVPGTWDASDFGLPSSHAAVAFAGLAALAVLFPRAWPALLALACGCGVTRMISRSHYLSDTLAGALVGVLAVAALVWLTSRRAPRTPPR